MVVALRARAHEARTRNLDRPPAQELLLLLDLDHWDGTATRLLLRD